VGACRRPRPPLFFFPDGIQESLAFNILRYFLSFFFSLKGFFFPGHRTEAFLPFAFFLSIAPSFRSCFTVAGHPSPLAIRRFFPRHFLLFTSRLIWLFFFLPGSGMIVRSSSKTASLSFFFAIGSEKTSSLPQAWNFFFFDHPDPFSSRPNRLSDARKHKFGLPMSLHSAFLGGMSVNGPFAADRFLSMPDLFPRRNVACALLTPASPPLFLEWIVPLIR